MRLPGSAFTRACSLPSKHGPARGPLIDSLSLSDDRRFMREAIRLAARVPARTWPNPPVGALVVDGGGRVVGRGSHRGPGSPHAETVALDEAGCRARGATLYCTLEPCNHQGRTPPCAPRVAASGIRRLVVGVADPNPTVAGGGLDVVRRAGVQVTVGVSGDEALELAWPFVATRAFERPYVVLKTATSLDARFAPPARTGPAEPAYLTGPEARRKVHGMRRWSDLVLVGAGTIAADRPRLDGRLATDNDLCPASDPLRGCVSTDLGADPGWRGPHIVFGGRRSARADRARDIEAAGGTVVLCEERDGRIVPSALLDGLAALGIRTVLLEGGPSLAASFLEAGLVDRWVAFVAPILLGDGPSWPCRAGGADARASFHLTRCSRTGADAVLVHDRTRFADTLAALTKGRER